jgi:hypothetical protein
LNFLTVKVLNFGHFVRGEKGPRVYLLRLKSLKRRFNGEFDFGLVPRCF